MRAPWWTLHVPRMKVKSVRRGGLLGLVGVGTIVAGCASLIAPKIVAPERGGLHGVLERSPDGQFMLQNIDAYISVRRHIAVGPPPADLAVAVVPPGRYSLGFGEKQQNGCAVLYLTGSAEAQFVESMGHLWLSERHTTEAEARKSHLAISITPAPAGSAILQNYRESIADLRGTSQARGTIILLPGYGLGKLSMLPWALLLGRAGYQSILIDLRAQGQSTGEHVTYGALESRDLVQLVAALRTDGLIRGPLGMLGNSHSPPTIRAPHCLVRASHSSRLVEGGGTEGGSARWCEPRRGGPHQRRAEDPGSGALRAGWARSDHQ